MSVRTVARETLIVISISVSLGLLYAAVYHKGLFAPASPTAATAQSTTPAPEMISLPEARRLFEGGEALFVDARHEYDFQQGHIRSAINVPLREFSQRRGEFATVQTDRTIVTYCDGSECNSSMELAAHLSEMGYRNVKIFFGGWQEWKSGQLPIER